MAMKALRKADNTVIALVGEDVSFGPRGTTQLYDVAVEAPGDFPRTSQINVLPSGEINIINAKHTYRFIRTVNGIAYICNVTPHELDTESKAFLEHLLKKRAELFENVRNLRRSFVG